MYRVVEITPPTAKPHPVAKPKHKKNRLNEGQILDIIKKLNKEIKQYPFWDRKYKHISKKYNEDLKRFIEREGDNLPKDDWGKIVLYFYMKTKKAPARLGFYKMLLEKIQNKTKEKEDKH